MKLLLLCLLSTFCLAVASASPRSQPLPPRYLNAAKRAPGDVNSQEDMQHIQSADQVGEAADTLMRQKRQGHYYPERVARVARSQASAPPTTSKKKQRKVAQKQLIKEHKLEEHIHKKNKNNAMRNTVLIDKMTESLAQGPSLQNIKLHGVTTAKERIEKARLKEELKKAKAEAKKVKANAAASGSKKKTTTIKTEVKTHPKTGKKTKTVTQKTKKEEKPKPGLRMKREGAGKRNRGFYSSTKRVRVNKLVRSPNNGPNPSYSSAPSPYLGPQPQGGRRPNNNNNNNQRRGHRKRHPHRKTTRPHGRRKHPAREKHKKAGSIQNKPRPHSKRKYHHKNNNKKHHGKGKPPKKSGNASHLQYNQGFLLLSTLTFFCGMFIVY